MSFYPESQLLALNLIFFFFKFLYADVLSHHVVPGALRNPKSASDPLELQSETAVNHHVGAEKPAWVLSASV